MQKHRVGSTDIEVSILGLGTVKFGRNEKVKYPSAFTIPSDKEIANLIALAKDLGINFLDTAPAYGNSEERLGKLLRGQRKDWILMTKAGEEFENGQSHFDFSQAAIQQSVERSLKRLQTDYLDIVLMHSNGDDERIIQQDEVFVTLENLKKSGKIRSFGMSTGTVEGGLLAIEQSDAAMVTYNLKETQHQKVIAAAHEKQKGIFIKKALYSGHLAGEDPVKAAFQFIFSEPGVTSVLIGTINPLHLKNNCATASNLPWPRRPSVT